MTLTKANRLTLLLLVIACLISSPLQASEPKSNNQVEYINGKLTVSVENMALGSLLATIREKTGMKFVVSPQHLEKPISVRFQSLLLIEGLKRILGHLNHALIFGPDDKLAKVMIMDYAGSENSGESGQNNGGFSEQSVVPPASTTEVMDIKPSRKEEMVVTYSTRAMVVEPTVIEGMVVTTVNTNAIKIQDQKPSSFPPGSSGLPTQPITPHQVN